MKILIVKLGALGDVLRTTPLLSAFKKKYPGVLITWVVDEKNRSVLESNPFIEELVSYGSKNLDKLKQWTFDIAINLDKEPEALETISVCQAKKKMGFGRAADGNLCALDRLSNYALRLGIDDELKFRQNQKTYQQISFEQAGLKFEGEEYLFTPTPQNIEYARNHLKKIGADPQSCRRPVIGINTGSGLRFAGKRFPVGHYVTLAERFMEDYQATIFLLGGSDEVEHNREIEQRLGGRAFNTGSHTIGQFASIVGFCDLVVTGDTTAMHIAIALKVPVIVAFGSTCAQEIELYGRGQKIISSLDCAPCYKKVCPIGERCMSQMNPEAVMEAVNAILGR